MNILNLNHAWIDNDGNFPDLDNMDNSLVGSDRSTHVYFRNLESHLVGHIEQADAVFGCAAWLTNGTILDALAKKDGVSIVVQKEDFLRPDIGGRKEWKTWLRKKYDSLSGGDDRHSFGNLISRLSVCCDPTIEPVRCVGNYNRDKAPAFPRMHNKFMLFAKIVEEEVPDDDIGSYTITSYDPYAVWTGSFNLTENSNNSLENAIFITDPEIVQAYYKEFEQIVAISEPLDWTVDWMAPQWRIGT